MTKQYVVIALALSLCAASCAKQPATASRAPKSRSAVRSTHRSSAGRRRSLNQGLSVVHREPDGSERTLNTLHAGDYFGEVGILTGHARNATVRAKTSLEVLALDADGLRTLMSSSQKTGDEVARVAKSRERIEDGAAN